VAGLLVDIGLEVAVEPIRNLFSIRNGQPGGLIPVIVGSNTKAAQRKGAPALADTPRERWR
jgi:hypothetical protein